MYTTQFIIFIEFIHSFVHSFVFIDLTSDVHKAARKPRCKQPTLNSGNNLMLTSIEDSKIKIYIIIMALVRALGFQNWARQRFLCVQRQLHKFPYSTENENAKEGDGVFEVTRRFVVAVVRRRERSELLLALCSADYRTFLFEFTECLLLALICLRSFVHCICIAIRRYTRRYICIFSFIPSFLWSDF